MKPFPPRLRADERPARSCHPLSPWRAGSTSGIIASILACVRRHRSRARRQGAGPTDAPSGPNSRSVVILPRDAHKSAVHGLVLSGATPSFVLPRRDPDSGVSVGVSMVDLRAALQEHGGEVSGARASKRGGGVASASELASALADSAHGRESSTGGSLTMSGTLDRR